MSEPGDPVGAVYDGFMKAKRCIEMHPTWSNEQIAEECSIHKLLIGETVVPARREYEADRPPPPEVTTTYEAPGA
jgi:hypothetical protein